jgi:hypothetical protein
VNDAQTKNDDRNYSIDPVKPDTKDAHEPDDTYTNERYRRNGYQRKFDATVGNPQDKIYDERRINKKTIAINVIQMYQVAIESKKHT